jgi:prepilin-type N-terminal cleavage/methylation domain-containing protein/prepilin-type processing-associated H-X9-DG protein
LSDARVLAGRQKDRTMIKRKAFTLIELLVVVAIIAVLIALLLPSLQRAKEHANRAKCLSNLRQLASAMIMYNNENQGRFPGPGTAQGEDDWIYWEITVAPSIPVPRNPDEGKLIPYMGGHFIPDEYRCPSDIIENHKSGSWGPYLFSYTVNNWICWRQDTTDRKRRLQVTQIKHPTEKILFVDESSETVDDGCWNWSSYGVSDAQNMLSNRHDKRDEKAQADFATSVRNGRRGNVAFVDGHCDAIDRYEVFGNFKRKQEYCDPLYPSSQ